MEEIFAIASSNENNRHSNDVKEITLPVHCRVVTMPEALGPSNKVFHATFLLMQKTLN